MTDPRQTMREFQRMADRVCVLILSSDLPAIDIEIEKNKVRERCLELSAHPPLALWRPAADPSAPNRRSIRAASAPENPLFQRVGNICRDSPRTNWIRIPNRSTPENHVFLTAPR